MLPFPDMVNFVANKLAGLRGRRFSFTRVSTRSPDRFFLWHASSRPILPVWSLGAHGN
jgi:hypothetical protein